MGVGQIKIKEHLSPAEAETRTELGKKKQDRHRCPKKEQRRKRKIVVEIEGKDFLRICNM